MSRALSRLCELRAEAFEVDLVKRLAREKVRTARARLGDREKGPESVGSMVGI
jgi:hypothetical protein